MAYDEGLATRVRDLIGDETGLVEKKMFGGLAMMLDGDMATGVHGWLLVDPAGITEDADLRRWVDRGILFARSLPAK
jgi:hypothetical protein